ncbi:MAG: hypothetical protein WBM17_08565 [Anaerolineales bacterium]
MEPWPESDHSAFAMRGVPALAFGGAGIREITHSAADTVDGMSGVKLDEAASLAAEIIMEMQDKPTEWGRSSPRRKNTDSPSPDISQESMSRSEATGGLGGEDGKKENNV